MDCNSNQRGAGMRRQQMQVPPYINTDCGCGGSAMTPYMAMPDRPQQQMGTSQPRTSQPRMSQPRMSQERMPQERMPQQNMSCSQGMVQPAVSSGQNACSRCGMMMSSPDMGGMPVAMAYTPWQQWSQTYPIEKGFTRGTIFPELDLPFVMGRCR